MSRWLGYSFRGSCVLVSTFAQVTSVCATLGLWRDTLGPGALEPHVARITLHQSVEGPTKLPQCVASLSAAFFPHFVDIYIYAHTYPTRSTHHPHMIAQIVGQHLLQRRTMPAAGPGVRGSMRGGMHASSGFGGMAAIRPARDRVMAVPQPHLGVAVSASKSHIDMMR